MSTPLRDRIMARREGRKYEPPPPPKWEPFKDDRPEWLRNSRFNKDLTRAS